MKETSPESVASVLRLREWERDPAGLEEASSRSRASSALPIASAQQASAIRLADASNDSKPGGDPRSSSENADSSAATAPGTVRFILGLPFSSNPDDSKVREARPHFKPTKTICRLIERPVLENAVLRAANGVLKAAGLDGLSNRGKTPVMDRLGPCGKWPSRELASSLGISRSSHGCQRRAIARPDRLAPLRALARRAFAEGGEGARGHRFVARELRGLGEPVRASEKAVPRIMRGEGLVPRWTRRKRRPYGSCAGGPAPAPPSLVRRGFRSAPPSFPWPTDITEFGPPPPGREVCLSAVRGRLDSSVVAWRAGERPDAALANSTPEGACARLTPGGRPVIHSDRGGRYRWPGWVSTCENNGLTRSMPARGRSPDNAAMEGLFGLPKKGLRHGGDWSGRTPARLIEGLGGRIGRYDTERRSDALGGRTPAEFRAALVEWSRFPGQLFKHLQAASRSKSQGAIYPFLECSRCLL